MSDSTVFVAVAVHTSDEKITGEQLRIKIAQQMAYDSHVAESETYVFHNSPVLDPNTRHMVLRNMPAPRSRMGIAPSQSSGLIGSPSSARSSSPIMHEPIDNFVVSDFSVYAPALRTELAKHKNDITKLTLASLILVGFSQEQIDACAQITGYSETQIVQAIVALILPEKEAKKLGIFVNTIPAALIGGLRIILAD
jgi:hypothetical protein